MASRGHAATAKVLFFCQPGMQKAEMSKADKRMAVQPTAHLIDIYVNADSASWASHFEIAQNFAAKGA